MYKLTAEQAAVELMDSKGYSVPRGMTNISLSL